MRAFVTGATGYLGSRVVLALLKSGATVDVVVRAADDQQASQRMLHTLMSLNNCDNFQQWKRLRCFAGDLEHLPQTDVTYDVVCHTAAIVKTSVHREELWRVNVTGTQHMVRWAERHQAKHFIYISSAYCVGRSETPLTIEDSTPYLNTTNNIYETSKREAENVVQDGNVPYSILRPSILAHAPGSYRRGVTPTHDPIGIHGWWSLMLYAAGLAREQQSRTLRVTAHLDSELNIVDVDALAQQVAEFAMRTPTVYEWPILLVAEQGLMIEQLLKVASTATRGVQLQATTSAPTGFHDWERLYHRLGGFFHAYATQRLLFKPSTYWHQAQQFKFFSGYCPLQLHQDQSLKPTVSRSQEAQL